MEIVVLLGLIIFNGLLAMSEIALLTAKKARLQKLVEEGDQSAAVALTLGEDSTKLLSTIQIGITSIGILNGIVGEAALSSRFADWLVSLGVESYYAKYVATALVVFVLTYVSIVVGELVPKRLGQTRPEAIARLVAKPMLWLSYVSKPFARLLSFSTDILLSALGNQKSVNPSVTEEEIHALLAEGSKSGVIERTEHTMVRNVFRLDDRQISSLMVPRSDIIFLDLNDPMDKNLQKIAQSDHSYFPVCKGGLGEAVLGSVSAKQLLTQSLQKGAITDLTHSCVEILHIPETLTCMEVLENFRLSDSQSALVVDEYGEIQGLITLQDLMEAITGEFGDPKDGHAWAMQREDGSWLLDGLIPILELKDRLGLRSVPEEERIPYQSLSGMIMLLLGRMPQTGDIVEWEHWVFEIVDMDGKRTDKVLASRKSTEPASPDISSEAKD